MPKGGSVNQTLPAPGPSRWQTMSFGELSRWPSKRLASTVIAPSGSVRVTAPCQVLAGQQPALQVPRQAVGMV